LLSVKVFKAFSLSRCAAYLSIAVRLARKGYQMVHILKSRARGVLATELCGVKGSR
jgi:hypothetical protein